MRCPYCSNFSNEVVDKRLVKGSGEIRRRRRCLKCGKRFTTYERLATLDLVVIKKDGRLEQFSRDKIRIGLVKALEKRPGLEQIDELVEKIERRLRKKGKGEVQSLVIGRVVLNELRKLDTVAYLRFASVYRQFDKIGDFTKELEKLKLNL